MKVIFLDVDGVLNYEGYSERLTAAGYPFADRALVEKLGHIAGATGAKVILSSTWRQGFYDIADGRYDTDEAKDYARLAAELASCGIEIAGATPMCGSVTRGEEIAEFFNRWQGEKIESFVILDDMPVMYPYVRRFVHTDYTRGLTDEDVAQAIAVLNRRN